MELKRDDAVQWTGQPLGMRGTVLKTHADRVLVAFADGTERWCAAKDVEPAKVWTTEEVVTAINAPWWRSFPPAGEDADEPWKTGKRHLRHGPAIAVPISLCENADEWVNQVHGKSGPVGEYTRNLVVCDMLVCGCWPCSIQDTPFGKVVVLHFDHLQPAMS